MQIGPQLAIGLQPQLHFDQTCLTLLKESGELNRLAAQGNQP
jgi:hypothetical protein